MKPSTFVGAARSAGWSTTTGAYRASSAAADGGLCSRNTSSFAPRAAPGSARTSQVKPTSAAKRRLCSCNTSSLSADGERGDGIDHELEPQPLLRQQILDARGPRVDHPALENAPSACLNSLNRVAPS